MNTRTRAVRQACALLLSLSGLIGLNLGGQTWAAPPALATQGGAAVVAEPSDPGLPLVASSFDATAGRLPTQRVDPGKPGAFRVVSGDYWSPATRIPGMSVPVPVRGHVVGPVTTSGKRPLVLLLHGAHGTCFKGAKDELRVVWPCPSGYTPVPSYRGFEDTQRLLASQGYVTVSIDANALYGQEGDEVDGTMARSALVRVHLARWADWAGSRSVRGVPAIVRATARADLSRVMLVGHSRGGEGVNRAVIDSLRPPPALVKDGFHGRVRWSIAGVVLIAPTADGQNPAEEVPSVVLLPACDGDVGDLQGQMYVDATRGRGAGAALHSSVYVVGANHNFFNREWTPGAAVAPASDDSQAPATSPCATRSPTRLSAPRQRKVGAVYVAVAARLFLARDESVLPLLDGSGRAASVGPARVFSHALGGGRTPAVVPDARTRVIGARLCAEVPASQGRGCFPTGDFRSASPHFVAIFSPEPDRQAVAMSWSTAGRPVRITPVRPHSLRGASHLTMRIITRPGTPTTRFGVAIRDTRGRRTPLPDALLGPAPGHFWAQEVRVPLPLHVRDVAALELVPRTPKGDAWFLDAWGWHGGLPQLARPTMRRVDIGSTTVEEGDSGSASVSIPISVTGPRAAKDATMRLFIVNQNDGKESVRLVRIRPDDHTLQVKIDVPGNTRFSDDVKYVVLAKALHGVVIGQFQGGVTVRNDDPIPTFTVSSTAARVSEGATLTWTVKLSKPADSALYLRVVPIKPAAGPELSVSDLSPTWVSEHIVSAITMPDPALSQVPSWTDVTVKPGDTSAEVSISTVVDTRSEPVENVTLRADIVARNGFGQAYPVGTLTGSVSDGAVVHGQ